MGKKFLLTTFAISFMTVGTPVPNCLAECMDNPGDLCFGYGHVGFGRCCAGLICKDVGGTGMCECAPGSTLPVCGKARNDSSLNKDDAIKKSPKP